MKIIQNTGEVKDTNEVKNVFFLIFSNHVRIVDVFSCLCKCFKAVSKISE